MLALNSIKTSIKVIFYSLALTTATPTQAADPVMVTLIKDNNGTLSRLGTVTLENLRLGPEKPMPALRRPDTQESDTHYVLVPNEADLIAQDETLRTLHAVMPFWSLYNPIANDQRPAYFPALFQHLAVRIDPEGRWLGLHAEYRTFRKLEKYLHLHDRGTNTYYVYPTLDDILDVATPTPQLKIKPFDFSPDQKLCIWGQGGGYRPPAYVLDIHRQSRSMRVVLRIPATEAVANNENSEPLDERLFATVHLGELYEEGEDAYKTYMRHWNREFTNRGETIESTVEWEREAIGGTSGGIHVFEGVPPLARHPEIERLLAAAPNGCGTFLALGLEPNMSIFKNLPPE